MTPLTAAALVAAPLSRPPSPVAALVAAGLGFLLGVYVRELARGFRADPPDTRAEAREAFGRLRTLPVPHAPPYTETLTAAVLGLVAWRTGADPAFLFLAVTGVALGVVDARTRRLPDALTLPAYPVLAALLAGPRFWPALLGGAAALLLYGALWFARPDSLGFGDVKLAGLLGMALGALGAQAWVAGALGGHLLAALYAAGLLATRRGTLKSDFPFGPFMLLGTLGAVLWAGPG
ncbi:prepilin peptidase [Bailinhaonella thermotolerans]|uniref:Prepilin peptidase n=1 Tax=Bailinhaonella thermotolerans TaxID=1070861 RepID=A0A3A4ARP3_9ACTN|nr:A24 family peptidase [Bailinhaonella thermotolerans]RJL31279.1 prepilin peptidase [Bailinhaonella thermotolerans]